MDATTIATTGCYGLRAPKGGCTVAGKVFKGGQFCLPFDPSNPHGLEASDPSHLATSAVFNIFESTCAAWEIPAGECGTVAFRLDKRGADAPYDVIRNHFSEVTCDCPDYEKSRVGTGGMCKHGRKLVELGMIPAPLPRPATPARLAWPRPRRFVPTPQECR